MVLFFTSAGKFVLDQILNPIDTKVPAVTPSAIIYMGKDKVESESVWTVHLCHPV